MMLAACRAACRGSMADAADTAGPCLLPLARPGPGVPRTSSVYSRNGPFSLFSSSDYTQPIHHEGRRWTHPPHQAHPGSMRAWTLPRPPSLRLLLWEGRLGPKHRGDPRPGRARLHAATRYRRRFHTPPVDPGAHTLRDNSVLRR